MGHAHHFLSRLDRVPRTLVDDALSLYRDPQRVLWILGHARVPQDVPRVALSLADPVRGPFVVVTRQGHFVTCLGEGMKAGDLPIVSRAHVDAYGSQLDENRSRRELAKKLTAASGHDEDDIVDLIYHRGDALSREDFLAVSAWQPFLMAEFIERLLLAHDDMIDLWKTVVDTRRVGSAADDLLQLYWKKLHSMGHLAMLLGMGAREGGLKVAELMVQHMGCATSWLTTMQKHTGVAVRGAWMAGRLGKPGIAIYQESLARATHYVDLIDVGLGLTAIGLRHANHRDSALRVLASSPAPAMNPALGELRESLLHTAALVFGDPDAAWPVLRGLARTLAFTTANVLASPSSPYHADAEDEVDDEHAKLELLNAGISLGRGIDGLSVDVLTLALFARREPEDLYMPVAMRREVGLPYSRDRVILFVDGVVGGVGGVKGETIKRTAPKVGRNDPCPCGSGKKAKKCCRV